MALLERFSGAQTLPGTRQPQSIADTAVGVATEKFGRQIKQSAGAVADFGRLMQRHRDRVADLESERTVQDIDVNLKQKEDEVRQDLEPGALNLAENMLLQFDKLSEILLKGKPKPVQERVTKVLEERRPQEALRYAELEYRENQSYFRTEVANLYDGLIAGVKNAPENFHKAVASMETLIADTPLPSVEKRQILASGVDALREAWFKTLPPAERLHFFKGLEVQQGKSPDFVETGGFRGASGSDGIALLGETPRGEQKESSEELLGRFAALPARTRDRLFAETREELALASVAEGERIAELIATDYRTLDPLEIQNNPTLRDAQKVGFQGLLEKKFREEKGGLASLDWIHSNQTANTFSSVDSNHAAQAYAHLTSRGANPDNTARDILLSHKQVPSAYSTTLQRRLRSLDDAEVRSGFESLSGLHSINPVAIRAGLGGRGMTDALTKWHILTEVRGESGPEAALQIAEGNKPERRSQLAEVVNARRLQAGQKPVPAGILARLTRGRAGILSFNR